MMDSSQAHEQSDDGQNVVDAAFWTSRWDRMDLRTYQSPPLWHPVVDRFLPKRDDWTVFEIGCVPGGLLVYFNKEFGFRPAGIDFSGRLDMVRATLGVNGCPSSAELYEGDLFAFTPPRGFDVVFSAGFVEHFEDYMPAFHKHAECVRPGGFLVLTVPNYRYVQYLMHMVFDAQNLSKHRFEIMDAEVMRKAVEATGLHILFCGNVATFDYWIVQRGTGFKRKLTWLAEGIAGKLTALLAFLGLDKMPTRWLSPYTLCIAQKPDHGT